MHADMPMTLLGLRCQKNALHVYILSQHSHASCQSAQYSGYDCIHWYPGPMTHSIARRSFCKRSESGLRRALIDK